MELPILIRYISSKERKFGVFAEAGFIVGYLIYNREKPTTHDSLFYPGPDGSSAGMSTVFQNDVTPLGNSLNLQCHLDLGLTIQIGRRCSIITDVSINKGFTNIGNSGDDFIYSFYYY